MSRSDNHEPPAQELAVLRRRVAELEQRTAHTGRAGEELARFFDESLDLLCIAALDGYFKRLNPAWTVRLGWTLEELLAKPFIDFVHPDDRGATLAEVDRLAEGIVTVFFENRYRHRDGSYRWLRWTARPGPGGRRIYGIARDVSRQKRLERQILDVIDQEKERLGRELHDGLCQTLGGIAALSSTLARKLALSSDADASALAAEITELLNDSIVHARNMARGLNPVGLNDVGLEGALETLALSVQQLFRLSCEFECDRPPVGLCHEVEAHLFRIAQEAVHNAVTHGRADRIEISLTRKDGEGLLGVRDDGVGLPEEKRQRGGAGLHTMAYRARLIGGSIEVRPRTGNGTAVICAFPLPETSQTGANANHVRNED